MNVFGFQVFSLRRVLLLAILFFSRPLFAADGSEQFDLANKLYEQGKFSDAASAYEKIVATGSVSAAVYFNLGNAYFKSSQVGRAIAAYWNAEKLSPRDPDIRANLQFARNQVQNPTLLPGKTDRWLGRLTVNEWTILCAIGLWLCLFLLAAMQIRPALTRSLRSVTIASGLVTILFFFCVAAVMPSGANQAAVVIAPEAIVRSGPLDEAQQTFIAHDGAELAVLDAKDNWLQVTAGQRSGWLKREQVALVQ